MHSAFQQTQGTFTTTTFSGAGCTSPIDLCADGTFRGTLNGPVTAVATSVAPTSQPGVLIGVADTVIHDRRGDVMCTETFIFNATPGSDGEEGVLCEVTGGTGQWAGVTGYINGYGTTPPGEASTGRYAGKLTVGWTPGP
ncbi:MAG: hypothetical protein QOI99_973 [Actinomycetota bacterium]|nr:hypothetical protein [Actinomycetota bacterium]